MAESMVLQIIRDAISKIIGADNRDAISTHIRFAIGELESCEVSEENAVQMIKSAVVSADNGGGNPNLFYAFMMLEKPTPPPTQGIIKGGWTYRMENPVEQSVSSLKDLAKYVKQNSWAFVTDGPKMPSPQEAEERKQKIEALGNRLEDLATAIPQGAVKYETVDAVLARLRALGFFPDNLLVSNLARAFARAGLIENPRRREHA